MSRGAVWPAAALALAALLIAGAALRAQRLPSYSALLELLPALWQQRYPVAVEKFVPNPGGRGALRARVQGRNVYYYRFQAIVPRPVRGADESAATTGEPRTVEFWVRYRSWLREPYDLSFVRQDRLPGSGQRWIKVNP